MKKRVIFALLLPFGMCLLLWGLFTGNPVPSGVLVGMGTIVLGLSAAYAAPMLARKGAEEGQNKIDWQDERNKLIRERASWYSGILLIAAMAVSALALAFAGQIAGACVMAGLLLLYSASILFFSSCLGKKL